MKFPITRETLRAFDPVEEKKINNINVVEKHINTLVENICGQIKNCMLGPHVQILDYGNKKAMVLKNDIDRDKYAHHKIMAEKRFIWDGVRSMRSGGIYGVYGVDISDSDLINLLVEKLKDTFIDCDVIIDPLKTYIIIDWS